jgi:cobalt-zinc-cadmium efflux system outer membrane protein
MKRAFVFLFLILFSAPFAMAGGTDNPPDHPITLREALELLHARNPLLLSGRQHLEAVQANEITAGLRPNSVLTSANEDFNVFNPSRLDVANKQEFTDNVSQLIERGHKRQLRVEDARAATQVARDSYRDSERQLELAVKASFTGMLLAK